MSKQKRATEAFKFLATEAFKFLVLLPFDASARRLRDVINTTIRQAHGEPLFLDESGRCLSG
jgi:hypothetical protein